MRVTALAIHPVKACRAVAVNAARVGDRGFDGDRRWMVVDPSGRFISQREHPPMALIVCAVDNGQLRLEAPGTEAITIPATLDHGARVPVEVWGAHCEAIVHDDASAWFSGVLRQPCRAVYMPDDVERPAGDPDRGDVVSFADGFPYLLTTQSSLADLNRRLPEPSARMTMDRFRPNIVLDGGPAFAEDAWQTLRIGTARFRVTTGCDRCAVTTVDPTTGKTGLEPLRTLATFRRRDGKVWFGVNLVAMDPGAELRVGDEVTLDPPGAPG